MPRWHDRLAGDSVDSAPEGGYRHSQGNLVSDNFANITHR